MPWTTTKVKTWEGMKKQAREITGIMFNKQLSLFQSIAYKSPQICS